MKRIETLLDEKNCARVRALVPCDEAARALSDLLAALGDVTRIKILSALAVSPMCVGDLSVLLSMNQTTVSHQLKNLRVVGAVESRRQGRVSFYRVKSDGIVRILNACAACL